jgi:hypothetical protein
MSNDERTSTQTTVPPEASIAVGLTVLVLIVSVVVLVLGGGLAWLTGAVETWLDLPPMSMLIAVLGLSIIVTVFIVQGRIVNAIHDVRWGPFEILREHLERGNDHWDDDDDDAPVVGRRR